MSKNSVTRLSSAAPDVTVAVIGAGPGGIATGVELTNAGITDFLIIDRADEIGGTWHENTYPGVGVDLPSFSYQFSFARNPHWSRVFAVGAEVQEYHTSIAKRFGLDAKMRLDTAIVREQWDDHHQFWRLHTADGEVITTRFVISAVGGFVNPKTDIGIPGLDEFEGKIQQPSSWDHDYDHTGKRVAIIGTGASSVQITPTIAPEVAALSVFQRTPVWSLPKLDFRIPGWLKQIQRIPGVQAGADGAVLIAMDVAGRALFDAPAGAVKPVLRVMDSASFTAYRTLLRMVVRDPQTRAGLMPDYGMIAKRPTFSNTYLRAFNRDNVTLVTASIERFTSHGIRTTDGVEHPVDMVVLACGYEMFSDPETYHEGTIVGRNGFDLATFYSRNGLQAYQNVALPGLPNRWMVVGPYSWTGSSWHRMIEETAHHAVRAISEARRRGATVAEVRKGAHDAFHAEMFDRSERVRYYLNVLHKHARTYYRNSHGDAAFLRPNSYFQFRSAHRNFPLDDYAYDTAEPARVTQPLTAMSQPQRSIR